uniref:Uncharacterized protein n=1 Tax=Myoviridae sp. ctijX18 TaxID=2825154 RepID=A0A8S5USL2_9CAUD|nr:MAG TPA: hypothetical protein [Myoviridae sp. ctijX18]DAJ69047.1 MAG TPA: hypothetical protein [Caudoviricetes sp.]
MTYTPPSLLTPSLKSKSYKVKEEGVVPSILPT